MENDLISRKKLIDDLEAWRKILDRRVSRFDDMVIHTLPVVFDLVNEQKAVKAEPRWISVKERLPETEGDYLVCSEFADIRSLKIMTFALNLESVDEYCFAGEKRPGWWDFDGETGNYEWSHVTHWMPMPEPPKEE